MHYTLTVSVYLVLRDPTVLLLALSTPQSEPMIRCATPHPRLCQLTPSLFPSLLTLATERLGLRAEPHSSGSPTTSLVFTPQDRWASDPLNDEREAKLREVDEVLQMVMAANL